MRINVGIISNGTHHGGLDFDKNLAIRVML